MSGIEDPGTPPELPEEYADIYRDAYLRALAETPPVQHVEAVEPERDVVVPAPADDRSSRIWLIVAIVALLLIVAAYVAGDLLSDEEPEPTGAPAASSGAPATTVPRTPGAGPTEEVTGSTTPDAGVAPAWEGAVTPVAVEGVQASCTAPESVDSANQPVTYAAENTIDADDSTAWRCNGRARGETITFVLPAGTEVAEVGLIPGYAKTDPISGTDRYAENNRITKVRWTLADGVVLDQVLDPDPSDRALQSIRVPATATGEVVLEIRSVDRGTRNTTAISAVVISAAA